MKTIMTAALLAVSMTATAGHVFDMGDGDYTIRNDDGTTTFITNMGDGDYRVSTPGRSSTTYTDLGDGDYMATGDQRGFVKSVPILGIIPQR